MDSRLTFAIAVGVLAAAWADPAEATTVRQVNLAEMCERADKVFRGVVVQAQPGQAEIGGRQLPVVTYRLRVEEGFKGEFKEARGQKYVDLRLLGDVKAPGRGEQVRLAIPGLPRLQTGQSYLLLTTRPGASGLLTTVGLGQGLFRVRPGRDGEEAVNEHGNRELFRGMGGDERPGPMSYGRLKERIRGLVRDGGRR